MTSPAGSNPLILALDTASPVVSVALASADRVLASHSVEQARSSRALLTMVDETLAEGGARLPEVSGLVALRGPGSFTGLRVGLATVLGLHQALGIPATAVSTLEALATAAQDGEPATGGGTGRRLLSVVDALRGEWVMQPFSAGPPPRPLADAERLPGERAAGFAPATVVGFGLEALTAALGPEVEGLSFHEPPPLAPAAALAAARRPPPWRPELLTRPLYFRPPAVTLPKRRPGTPRPGRGRN